jgi:Predicted membrane protein
MIIESFSKGDDGDKKTPYGSLVMLVELAVATSIDAAATGILFVPLGNLIWAGISIIALGSFLLSVVGCVLGVFVGKKMQRFNVELIGGVVLVGIGIKIFVEHFFF